MADITVDKVRKNYGKVEALKDISLSVKSGEFVVLLGPSGSGKTTLLRCIAGLEKLDGGTVSIGDELANDLLPRERDIAMVFQNYTLFPLMTVRQNIAFPLKVRGVPQNEIDRRVKEVSDKLGISRSLDASPRQLSGGEQQRVAIGRAIIRQTNALLMDEPLSSLDAPLRAQLRTELKTLQKELGMTIIYVTHDQVEALAMADRMGVIDKGVLLQYGTPAELYNKPASSFVANFVGTPGANLIGVVVSSKNGSVSLQGLGVEFAVPTALDERLMNRNGQRVILAIRPEDITLGRVRKQDSFEVQVELIEPIGSTQILDVRAGEVPMKVLVSPAFAARVGERLWGSVNFDRAEFFDDASDAPI